MLWSLRSCAVVRSRITHAHDSRALCGAWVAAPSAGTPCQSLPPSGPAQPSAGAALHRIMAVCARMPVLAIPHGGGPCFQLPDGSIGPPGFWLMMGAYLKTISKSLPAKPKAMLMCVARASAKRRPLARACLARACVAFALPRALGAASPASHTHAAHAARARGAPCAAGPLWRRSFHRRAHRCRRLTRPGQRVGPLGGGGAVVAVLPRAADAVRLSRLSKGCVLDQLARARRNRARRPRRRAAVCSRHCQRERCDTRPRTNAAACAAASGLCLLQACDGVALTGSSRRPEARLRPRRVRAAAGGVPAGGRARHAAVAAAQHVARRARRHGAGAGAAARRGRAHRRLRHDIPQHVGPDELHPGRRRRVRAAQQERGVRHVAE